MNSKSITPLYPNHGNSLMTPDRKWKRELRAHLKTKALLGSRMEQAYRYQAAILEIAKTHEPDLLSMLRKITEAASKALQVELVSVWRFNQNNSAILCEDIYCLSQNQHTKFPALYARDYPRYFEALHESRTLPISDAQSDSRTSEFTETYLKPLGVTSMLDVPFRLHGQVVGIVCHEHVGPKREWSHDEMYFAASVADMVSLAFETDERVKAEIALQAKNLELQQSNEELKELTVFLSHEMQTPHQLIQNSIQKMERELRGRFRENDLVELKRIGELAERSRSILDSLLRYAQATSFSSQPQELDLKPIIEDILVPLRRSHSPEPQIEINALPSIKADPQEMRILFENLLNNAIKFQKPGAIPQVKIEGRYLKDEWIEIAVQDNGIGFDPSRSEEIFKPFHRLVSQESYPGNGVGLAICQKIATNYGGKITASAATGAGAMFKLTLKQEPTSPNGH